MSGTRRARKQGFLSNKISALFGDNMFKAKHALALLSTEQAKDETKKAKKVAATRKTVASARKTTADATKVTAAIRRASLKRKYTKNKR